MATAPSLYTVLASLRGGDSDGNGGGAADPADPAAALAAAGHADLPAALVAEAIVSYADTAPVEVAEHLAPFVTAHTSGTADPVDPAGHGLGLLATAPPPAIDPSPVAPGPVEPGATEPPADPYDLAFGAGEVAGEPGSAGLLADAFGAGAGAAPQPAEPHAAGVDPAAAEPAGPGPADPAPVEPDWASVDPMDLFAVPPAEAGPAAEPAPDDRDDLSGG